MKAKDWQSAAKLIKERQSQAATADSSELSSFPLSELLVDKGRPPTVLQGPYVPLSTSRPVRLPQGNQQTMDSAPDECPFQQVISSILPQSLYPSLAALGTSANMALSPLIPFSRRVINDIEEQQRKALKDTVKGTIRSTNTSPTSEVEEQEEGVITPSVNLQAGVTQPDIQEETLQQESSEIEDTGIKKVDTQEDQIIGPTEVQNTGNTDERAVPDLMIDRQKRMVLLQKMMVMTTYPMTKILPCRMIRHLKHPKMTIIVLPLVMMISVTQCSLVTQSPNHSCQEVSEVGCISFTQMFQDYLHEYPPPSQADALLQIQEMAQRLGVYLNRYPAQYINCMTSDSEFVTFANHAIQLALDFISLP